MVVTISATLLDAVLAHARARRNEEVCGLLWGTPARIDDVEPTENVAPDPSAWFEINPRRLFEALRAARSSGRHIIGHYHSHPNGRAEPSSRDADAAEPGKYWLIIGGDSARLWLATAEAFEEIDLIVA